MPRPEAVIQGFVKLQQLIAEGKANGAQKYLDNLEWYKENQRKIAPKWIAKAPDYNW
jgi:NADH-quinone oxidoreductase subunit B